MCLPRAKQSSAPAIPVRRCSWSITAGCAVQLSENGRPRTVATLSEGAFFGEMALFTGEPRTANIVALEETEVLEIGHQAMKLVFDTNPDLVESLSHIITERRQALAASEDLGAGDIDESAGLLSAIKRFFGIS